MSRSLRFLSLKSPAAVAQGSHSKCFYSMSSSAEFLRKWRSESPAASTSSSPNSPSARSIFDDDSPVDLSEDDDAVNGVRSSRSGKTSFRRKPSKEPTPQQFKAHRTAMQKEFPQGWNPPRKLSREAMEGLRQLYHLDKEKFSTPVLAERFKISPEAVRRILKSKWVQPRERREKAMVKDREDMTLTRLKERLKERKEIEQVIENRTGRSIGANGKDGFAFR
ncbi:Required for respiratory growth protein 9 mitochondrial [Stygiomarasmius scandens]|uniref:Required for respiratory growth protein 9, mitochondrial n=1 Tax=Marasmiellus scandens TaxID=2682957 RepID=A0ABR1JQB5_9AGAR